MTYWGSYIRQWKVLIKGGNQLRRQALIVSYLWLILFSPWWMIAAALRSVGFFMEWFSDMVWSAGAWLERKLIYGVFPKLPCPKPARKDEMP